MRYYPAVGPAIPHKSVGCSRVTHPFAGEVLLPPHDLHVLSTPPAFVLSQDQTLQENSISSFEQLSHAVACDSVSESLCLSQNSHRCHSRHRINESPRTSSFPKSIFNQRLHVA